MSAPNLDPTTVQREPPQSNDRPPGSNPTAAVGDAGGEHFTWSGWLHGFAVRSLLLFVLYVLSIGPMYWEWYRGRFAGGSKLLAAFYEPLVVLAELIPPFGQWMDWYVGLWIT